MSSVTLPQIASVFAALGAMTLAFALYRLASINSFIDNRKNLIRSVFREACEAFPELSVLVQKLGRSGESAREIELLVCIHPVLEELVKDISALRERYKQTVARALVLIVLLLAITCFVAVFAFNVSVGHVVIAAAAVTLWLLVLWGSVQLRKPRGSTAEAHTALITSLEGRKLDIQKFAQSRRAKLLADAGVA